MSRRSALALLKRMEFAHRLVGDERKGKVYGGAVWPLSRFEGDFEHAAQTGELDRVRGVGASVVEVVRAGLAGRVPAELEALEAEIPAGLFELGRLKGLGPAKVKVLWQTLGIESVNELEYACVENRLVQLDGFGAKTQLRLLAQIRELRAKEGLLRRDQALVVWPAVEQALGRAAAVVGELRRGHEVVRELDLVVQGDVESVEAALGSLDPELRVIDGGVALTVMGVPVRVFAGPHLGTELVRHSAGDAHLEALLEHGPLPEAPTEQALYTSLGFHTPPAELRDRAALLPLAQRQARLVRRDDLQGALHNHSTASDGVDTLEDMQAAATALGLRYLGMSEHSEASAYARGLSPERLRAQRLEIAALNARGGCTLLAGIEADILQDGELDYGPELLGELDFVVASVHQRFRQGPEEMTARMLRAVRSPSSDLIGHPTGRLLLGRGSSGVDIEQLLDACAETGTAVELNASPHRLDLSVEHLRMARERGVMVSIGADAHSVKALSNLDHGVALARRAELGPEQILNTRSLTELETWLAQRRA